VTRKAVEVDAQQEAEEELVRHREGDKWPEKKINGESVPEPQDYDELTGLTLLRKFADRPNGNSPDPGEERDIGNEEARYDACSKLWGTGRWHWASGMLVSSMLELEEHCNSLTPLEREDVTRAAWISRLEGAPCMERYEPPLLDRLTLLK
jgi:hypothetical protein